MEVAVGTKEKPSQTAAMDGASKGFTTLPAATPHRSDSREATYAIADINQHQHQQNADHHDQLRMFNASLDYQFQKSRTFGTPTVASRRSAK
ncbi:hypothetical protein RB195_023732 [Necator americanus]|uniref:Uncharacterized protein n=1 Tax=Necator americanus TaxID=51031 RepID=A0ABR1EKD1_NECAM